ncbi:MAG: tetratricopeptide repeat protein [Chloroflexi bacterium]|nr:tetratricopeptide repeat protein [Chloroflexota bacterium]
MKSIMLPVVPEWLRSTLRRSPELSVGIVVWLVTAAVFAPVLSADFVQWDDDINIYRNPNLARLDLKAVFWMFTDVESVQRYKPLTWLTWALLYQLFELRPWAYHMANWLFHCGNAVLVFLLLLSLMRLAARTAARPGDQDKSVFCAGLGALFWAIHPLRVEPVAWVSGLGYLQALFVMLISLLCYLKAGHADFSERSRKRLYWLSVAAFAGSLLTYPTGIGYAGALFILDIYPLKRLQVGKRVLFSAKVRSVLLEKVPFLVVTGLVLLITLLGRFSMASGWPKAAGWSEFTPGERLMQAFYLWTYYLWKPWLPFDLSPVYTKLLHFRTQDTAFVASAIAVLAITIAVVAWRRRLPFGWALWFCYLIMLVPHLGLTEHPYFSSDRYSYIAGLCWSVLLLPVLGQGIFDRRPPAIWMGLLLLGCFGLLSVQQIRIWQNSVVLFEHTIARLGEDPYRVDLYYRLGVFHAERNHLAPAVESFQNAISIKPDFVEAHWRLGNALYAQGNFVGAARGFSQALRLKPGHADLENNLGDALLAQGNLDAAIGHYSEAVKIDPRSAEGHRNLAIGLAKMGRLEEAEIHFAEVTRLNPNDADARENLALTLKKQGKMEAADYQYSEAKRIRAQADRGKR